MKHKAMLLVALCALLGITAFADARAAEPTTVRNHISHHVQYKEPIPSGCNDQDGDGDDLCCLPRMFGMQICVGDMDDDDIHQTDTTVPSDQSDSTPEPGQKQVIGAIFIDGKAPLPIMLIN